MLLLSVPFSWCEILAEIIFSLKSYINNDEILFFVIFMVENENESVPNINGLFWDLHAAADPRGVLPARASTYGLKFS